jgi:predicted XRE-type DNA-binding protein
MTIASEDRIAAGSGNVFADLGFPNPEEHLRKAELVYLISRIIAERGLTQAPAAAALGPDQPQVSALVRGRFRGGSTGRLLRLLNRLGQDVTITVAPAATPEGRTRLVIAGRP